ncbi:MAG TPA: cytochrome c [Panacibacter sp.]|nr:cytochrome c [Panacibacter sp.]
MQKNILVTIALFLTVFTVTAQTNTKVSIEKGKKIYETYCLTCHQVDGDGVPKLNPPLIKTSYVTGDKKKLIKWVLQGTTEKIEIDGKIYSNNMAPQAFLKDQEIADVLTYIRNSFGNKGTAVTLAEVSAVRVTIK